MKPFVVGLAAATAVAVSMFAAPARAATHAVSPMSWFRGVAPCFTIGRDIPHPVVVDLMQTSAANQSKPSKWTLVRSETLTHGHKNCMESESGDGEILIVAHLPHHRLAVRVANMPYTLPFVSLNSPVDFHEYAKAYFWEGEAQTLVGDAHVVHIHRGDDTTSLQHYTVTFEN